MGVFSEEQLNWPDVVVFGRTYFQEHNPLKWMNEFKRRGKRVLYDMDDDFWEVAKHNPSVATSNALRDQYESLIKASDAVITPSSVLAKKFKKHFKKPVFICPNGVDFKEYIKMPKDPLANNSLVIGYMGASSHWKDLGLIIDALEDLSTRHDFLFVVYGIVAEPIEAAIYTYHRAMDGNFAPEKNEYFQAAIDTYSKLQNIRMMHVPFMPPELHPMTLSRAGFDIALAPLEDSEFNKGKSCIKFYEYAATGAVTLASDVEPYKSEVGYRAKNTKEDWIKKIEKLITDDKFREKLRKEQHDWVLKNRNIGGASDPERAATLHPGIGVDWEKACQLPGGLKVHNQ